VETHGTPLDMIKANNAINIVHRSSLLTHSLIAVRAERSSGKPHFLRDLEE
jgi:hypothetical protein